MNKGKGSPGRCKERRETYPQPALATGRLVHLAHPSGAQPPPGARGSVHCSPRPRSVPSSQGHNRVLGHPGSMFPGFCYPPLGGGGRGLSGRSGSNRLNPGSLGGRGGSPRLLQLSDQPYKARWLIISMTSADSWPAADKRANSLSVTVNVSRLL
jgi:hypothetical protein